MADTLTTQPLRWIMEKAIGFVVNALCILTETQRLGSLADRLFDYFSTKERVFDLLPLKTTTRGVGIYNTVKDNFVEKKITVENLVIYLKVMTSDQIMTPVVKIINSFQAKAKQQRSFKLLLKEYSVEYEDPLRYTESRLSWNQRRIPPCCVILSGYLILCY
ncbi:general transcription factor II-I repeat domain-containing protein 2-like%2C partial [Scomber scombrus]|uniref:General transcription factor II-I repeat domain-containing protein 2-like, partial n=1 Tax=Scomber scombrus TaxID=13677 RepID=A0AAV1MTY8_SCOSC